MIAREAEIESIETRALKRASKRDALYPRDYNSKHCIGK
jgi:hypothetical protein